MAHSFRNAFDLDPSLIYLNAGTHSICPRAVTDAVVRNLREYEQNPTGGLVGIWGRLWKSQQQLATFVNARPQELFLRPNVTAAMNAFILGVRLPDGPGEILISDSEYGAIANVCQYRAERSGLRLRTFHLPGTAEELREATEESLVQTVVAALKPDTRMLMLSHVTTGHGLKLPIARIAKETRKRGILFAVDGAHATGALPLDFRELEDVDFYGGNLHKWLMGPKGTGFGWVPERHHSAIEPSEIGWTTYETDPQRNYFAPGSRFTQKMLQASSYDFAPFLALDETFTFWKEQGTKKIHARLGELQTCVQSEMSSRVKWPLLAPADRLLCGPLLAYDLPQHLETEGVELMQRMLRQNRLQISTPRLQGRWVLRISPHIHNTEDEIRRAAEILAGI